MRLTSALAALAAAALPVAAADPLADSLKPGTPAVKSISALAFGPGGVILLGDSAAGTITAVATGDTSPGGKGDVNVEKIDDKVASALGTTAENVTINDVKVNPASGNVFLAVSRKTAGGPVVLKLDRAGKLAELKLADVPFAQVTVPAGPDAAATPAFTGLAYLNGKVIAAGASKEEFASTLWVIPVPFAKAGRGTGIEVFHGAHGKLETRSPIQTFAPYQIGGADYLMAAYTCTPLAKIPVADLKPGEKLKATTIAELGNGNKPLDMVVYNKGGKDYLLLANSKRGVMKIPTDGFGTLPPITEKVGSRTPIKYDTVEELKGVMHLDKLDADRALLLVQNEDKTFALKSVPLP